MNCPVQCKRFHHGPIMVWNDSLALYGIGPTREGAIRDLEAMAREIYADLIEPEAELSHYLAQRLRKLQIYLGYCGLSQS